MKKAKTKPNKLRISYILKDLLLLLLVVTVYAFSVYINGFSYTNYKLLNLIIYCAVGFAGAILIYYIVYVIFSVSSYVKEKKRKKTFKNFMPIDCSGNCFSYNYKKSFKENLIEYSLTIEKTLERCAENCGYKGKYSYLNFTFEDAHSFARKVLTESEEKVDNILSHKLLKKFDLANKPIAFLESTLHSVLEEEKKPKIKEDKKSGLMTKLLGKVVYKSVDLVFGNFINNKLNSLINYIGKESALTYAKNNYKYINKRYKKSKKDASLEVVK